MGGMSSALAVLHKEVIQCTRCPRLVAYREQIGREKRRAYRDHEYWARPVPGFGDPHARVLVLGLAPGAHGSNRTGRPFTGDASGKFMYPILYKVGFANQPNADDRDDGLKLTRLLHHGCGSLRAAGQQAAAHGTRQLLVVSRPRVGHPEGREGGGCVGKDRVRRLSCLSEAQRICAAYLGL